MAESIPPTPLTEKALLRLRALANGNGIEPEKIVLTAGEEKIYTFEGTITLTPFCETKNARYNGPMRGKDRIVLPSFEALHADAEKRKKVFEGRADWIEAASADLRKEPGEGWGFDGARIELPSRSVILAATEACPTCRGNKNIPCTRCGGRCYDPCTQCRGTRFEWCYNCNVNNSGMGLNPVGQVCPVCRDIRRIPCRMCSGNGQTPCPVCQARGSTPCTACNSTGQMTEEIQLICGATTHFSFKADGLPSGLRRGLDRLGIANLSKGHADVVFLESKAEPEYDEEED